MDKTTIVMVCLTIASSAWAASAADTWQTWPPHDYLMRSLVEGIPRITKSYHPETGRFGAEPWVCRDQNHIFPLAVAWGLEDDANPYYHSDEILEMIARGGEALVDAQDDKGQWTFRKKDNSTWGQILMPWTYSRWIRAFAIVRDALPEASRAKWEQGLLLGYRTLVGRGLPRVHNIPTHHAMSLYIAGECFDNEEWKAFATEFMSRAVAEQDPAGFWSENFGPVVGYNFVYVDALGVYYSFSHDPVVLEALQRAAIFHSSVLWPDGSSVSCIDERQIYHSDVALGNIGFSWTPEGRGFLLKQVGLYSEGGEKLVDADYAASMLMYGGEGDSIPPASDVDEGTFVLGANDAGRRAASGQRPGANSGEADESNVGRRRGGAVIRRDKPWQWALSGYVCPPPDSRWIQDRGNLVDVYHDDLGLVVGGGNCKLQPYWSTFTVGDPTLLFHTPGDEKPDFTPDIDLQWTADEASINTDGEPVLTLRFGEINTSVTVNKIDDDTVALTYRAPAGQRVEGHLPLQHRSGRLLTDAGELLKLTEANLSLTSEDLGGGFTYRDLHVSVPEGARLLWPARHHNQYKKDGSSSLGHAKPVIVMPFEDRDEYTVTLTYTPPPPFDGVELDARKLPVEISEGSYTKTLDGLGSQFLGNNKPGSFIRFTLPEIAPGRYEVSGDFVLAYVYGIVRVLFDGEQIGGEFDAYCEGVDAEGFTVSFGEVEIGAGAHTLTIEIVGQNEKATNDMISIKRWLLGRR